MGLNPDSTTGDRICYTWQADREGVYLFSGMADTRSGEDGTNVHGLFGAIIVEEAGSSWYDPVTGEPMDSGLFADVYHPVKPAFREYAVFFHDELEILTKENQPPVDPHTGLPNGTTAISYRSEPMRNRLPLDHHADPADTAEDISMSSWAYGDPAPPILRAYVGDPSKIRLIHGGVKETHVFHLHNHQWRLEPEDLKSTIIDSISISPQECYTLDILYGAGSLNGMIGDAIFHCHLYPHFHEGMWTLWRVFDRLQDGGGRYPDGTPIETLVPLQDRPLPPPRDDLHPGYPTFVEGTFGAEPLQPPLGVLTPEGVPTRSPSPLEAANFVEGFAPGTLYTRTCPCDTPKDIKVFELAAVQAKMVYNDYGWHDPQGRFFVLKEDIEREGTLDDYLAKVERRELQPEPLVLRANAGDWVEITLHNLFDPNVPIRWHDYPSVPLDLPHTPGDRVSLNPPFLKYDPVASPGVNVGYNPREQTAGPGECVQYLWHADREYGTCLLTSFGDLRNHRYHGLFGALIVEPPQSRYYSGICPLEENYREEAVITAPGVEAFREFVLFAHNGIRLLDRQGQLIKTTEQDLEGGGGGHDAPDHEDTGEKGYNYRSERFLNRLREIPLIYKVFDSKVHGDPATPLLRSYTGERVVICLLMPGDKPRNISFALHGHCWPAQPDDPFTRIIPVQGAISVGNVFNLEPERTTVPGDYLYRSGSLRWDMESGMWGIYRVLSRGVRYCCQSAFRRVRQWWEKTWYEK